MNQFKIYLLLALVLLRRPLLLLWRTIINYVYIFNYNIRYLLSKCITAKYMFRRIWNLRVHSTTRQLFLFHSTTIKYINLNSRHGYISNLFHIKMLLKNTSRKKIIFPIPNNSCNTIGHVNNTQFIVLNIDGAANNTRPNLQSVC